MKTRKNIIPIEIIEEEITFINIIKDIDSWLDLFKIRSTIWFDEKFFISRKDLDKKFSYILRDKTDAVLKENCVVKYKLQTLNSDEISIEVINKKEIVNISKEKLKGKKVKFSMLFGSINKPRKGITAPILIISARDANIFKKIIPKKTNLVFLLKFNMKDNNFFKLLRFRA